MDYTIKNVVIFDDTNYKRENIIGYIRNLIPEADIFDFDTVNKGLLFLNKQKRQDIIDNPGEWLIVTDMYMPYLEGGEIHRGAGERVLQELRRLNFECPAIAQSSEPLDKEKLQGLYKYLIGTVLEEYSTYNEYKYEALLEDFVY